MTIGYLEDRIAKLEMEIQNLQEEHEALVEGVRYLHSQIIHDEPQVQQTTEEFVRVVRCKDCMYCKAYNDVWYRPKKDALVCINDKTEVNADDYCSWGERRGE